MDAGPHAPRAWLGGAAPDTPGARGVGRALVGTPRRLLVTTLVAGTALRLVASAVTNLGVDESYQLVQGRRIQASYFDHPPLSYLLGWLSTHLAGSEAPWVLRLPFVLLFVGTCLLLHAFTRRLFDDATASVTVLLLNLMPLFGLGLGGWCLPDGPMLFGLAASACALLPVLAARGGPVPPGVAYRAWIVAGACAGLALLSKYLACFYVLGLGSWVASVPAARRWLRHPAPYLGALAALLVFSPALLWNAQHGWVSFAFQGGRAASDEGLRPLHLLGMVAGQAAYLLPWFFVLVWIAVGRAARRGRSQPESWLCLCLGAPAALVMTLVPLWGERGLPHWPAVGYLFLSPVLAAHAVTSARRPHPARVGRWLAQATVASVLVLGVYVSHAVSGWAQPWLPAALRADDPTREMLSWEPVEAALRAQGVLPESGVVLATLSFVDGAKLGAAVGGRYPVTVLSQDPRNFAFQRDPQDLLGRDVVLVGTARRLRHVPERLGDAFASIEPLGTAILARGAGPEVVLDLLLARRMQKVYLWPYGTGR